MFWAAYEDLFNEEHPLSKELDANFVNHETHRINIEGAIIRNDVNRLKSLLETGIGIDYVYVANNSLLHLALLSNKNDVFEYLLSLENVPLDAKNVFGQTPLFQALHRSQADQALKLIHRGADIHLATKSEQSPLYGAIYGGCVEIARILIELGADLNVRDVCGVTPLWCACVQDNVEAVCMLLYYGADPSIPTITRGYPPFHVARPEIQEVLFDYVYDEYKSPVLLSTLTSALAWDSPLLPRLFDCVSDVYYSNEEVWYFYDKLPVFNPQYFRLFLERFNCIKHLLTRGNIIKSLCCHMGERAIKNLMALCESDIIFYAIKGINKFMEFANLGYLLDGMDSIHVTFESKRQIILALLFYGIKIDSSELDAVFVKYGFGSIFKEMLEMNFTNTVPLTKKRHLMPRLVYDVSTTIETFLRKPHLYYSDTLDLVLENFANPRFKEYCLKFGTDALVNKAKEVPTVPLLMELSRDVSRRHIMTTYTVQNCRQFYEILEKLPIPGDVRRIRTFERKLYSTR